MEFKTLITRVGLAKIANATALGYKINLKQMAFGDGNGDYPTINEDMTQLVNEVHRGDINNVEVIDDSVIRISQVIPAQTGGFFIREVGVYDDEGDLIAIGIFPESYKPTIEEGATKDIMARMLLRVSNVDSVALKIDPNVVVATKEDIEDLRDEFEILVGDIDLSHLDEKLKELEENKANKDKLEDHERWIHESVDGRHGIKVVDENKLAFYNGYEWIEVIVDPKTIRDIDNTPLKLQVSDKEPPAEDGRIYYNSSDKLFYVSRNNQWYRLFVGGDEKLDREAPSVAPKLISKTDTTVTLEPNSDMEFRYQGGSWQEDSEFAGLQRNETYKFEQRYKADEIYKSSPPSPALNVTTDKGTQTAPSNPSYEILGKNSSGEYLIVKVNSLTSNTEVALVAGNVAPSQWSEPGTLYRCDYEKEYTIYARRKESHTHKPSPHSSGLKFTTPANLPGPSNIAIGDKEEGYYGVVPASELITGNELASRMNVTQGTPQHSNTPWHKFAWKGKTLFIAQKTIRHSISWDHLNSKDVIYGNKTIEIDGVRYKVRLIRGALTDPSKYSDSDRGAKGSEWNRLIVPLNHQRKDNSWDYSRYIENDLQDWKTYLSDSDMVVSSGSGKATWCQEVSGDDSAYRVHRGSNGVSHSETNSSPDTYFYRGWRPVLEVVG